MCRATSLQPALVLREASVIDAREVWRATPSTKNQPNLDPPRERCEQVREGIPLTEGPEDCTL
jgi:hypothetical protein